MKPINSPLPCVIVATAPGASQPDWREEARAKATAAAAAREPGYYWIKRNEPDGQKGWEPAEFVKWRVLGTTGWLILGTNGSPRPEVHPPFSNAWEIGERIVR